MERGYQHNYSELSAEMHDLETRQRKAKTMHAILQERIPTSAEALRVLEVGASTGAIDDYLADYYRLVVATDIDIPALQKGHKLFQKDNLHFQLGDSMQLQFADESFEVVICTHVYEHVPSAEEMMAEIYRVLVPGGVCYFGAGNRLKWDEPHYHLPLLSAIPRPLAHRYIRLAGKADYYHELHYSYWGLRQLVKDFILHDYTAKTVLEPKKYHVDYMLRPDSFKAKAAQLIVRHFMWLSPGYIWVLEKPTT